MPVQPLFKDDNTNMPLQAANLTVWMRHREGLEWLRPHFVGLTFLESATFGSHEIRQCSITGCCLRTWRSVEMR